MPDRVGTELILNRASVNRLRQEARRTGRSFDEIVNGLIEQEIERREWKPSGGEPGPLDSIQASDIVIDLIMQYLPPTPGELPQRKDNR